MRYTLRSRVALVVQGMKLDLEKRDLERLFEKIAER
jgi:hypothetical protein